MHPHAARRAGPFGAAVSGPDRRQRNLIEADTIIGAIGQSTNTQFLYNDLPVKLNKWGDIEINGKTSQTSEDNIFAVVTASPVRPRSSSVAAGRRAAMP
jgi:formate dehydrogenase major subunit